MQYILYFYTLFQPTIHILNNSVPDMLDRKFSNAYWRLKYGIL